MTEQELQNLIPHGFNAILIAVIGFFIKGKLSDICDRITRIENTFFTKTAKED
jgi:hypothetical protein